MAGLVVRNKRYCSKSIDTIREIKTQVMTLWSVEPHDIASLMRLVMHARCLSSNDFQLIHDWILDTCHRLSQQVATDPYKPSVMVKLV